MSNTHQFSDEEERQFQLTKNLSLEPLSDGWNENSRSKDKSIILYTKMVPEIHDSLHLTRTHVTINAPVKYVAEMLKQENMPRILPLMKDHQVIEQLSERTFVFFQHYTTEFSWFISDRGFVTLASSREDKDPEGRNRLLYINSVIQHPKVSVSPKKGVVLGELSHNGIYCIEENGKTHLIYLLLVDPKGNIPQKATEWNAGKTIHRMELMKEVAEDLYANATQG